MLIGVAQVLALLPGISRSGVTMVAGLVGADKAVTSCDLRILVEEAAKPVASLNADVVVCGRDVGSPSGGFWFKAGGGLYWLIPAAVASLLGGVVNAWLFLVKATS